MIPRLRSKPSSGAQVGWARYEPPGSAWIERRFAAVVAGWSPDANDDSATERTRAVCPFCGRSYDEPRQRCTACGGLPVVATDDRRVYDVVLAECGPGCDRVANRRTTGSP